MSILQEQLQTDFAPCKPTLLAKIDYYSSMWYCHSLREVLRWLHLEDCLDFVLKDYSVVSSVQLGNKVVLKYNGIFLELPFDDFISIRRTVEDFVTTDDIKDYKFTKIRLSLSGVPLDFLRQHFSSFVDGDGKRLSLDEYLRIPPTSFGLDFRVTRVDLAFDFINYSENEFFFKRLFGFLADFRNLTRDGRLSTYGQGAGVSYRPINTVNDKRVYLGTTSAERYLRIYDKYLESQSRCGGAYNERLPGIHPLTVQSHIRVEWQLRNGGNHYAEKFLYAQSADPELSYWDSILIALVDFYEFRSLRNQKPIPPKFWREFFNTQKIGTLDKIVDFVYYTGEVRTAAESNDGFIEHNAMMSTLLYVLRHKESALILLLRKEWLNMITPIQGDPLAESIRLTRLKKFRSRLNETVPPGKTVEETYPWAFDEKGNLQYPRYEFLC